MATYFRLGCGEDVSNSGRDRRDLGIDAKGKLKAESCTRARTLRTLLLRQQRNVPIESIFEDLNNPGKMCHNCFNAYERYSKILLDNLQKAISGMPTPAHDRLQASASSAAVGRK